MRRSSLCSSIRVRRLQTTAMSGGGRRQQGELGGGKRLPRSERNGRKGEGSERVAGGQSRWSTYTLGELGIARGFGGDEDVDHGRYRRKEINLLRVTPWLK